MHNFNLQAPAGQGLGGANLVELKKEELMEIEGGNPWWFIVAVGVKLISDIHDATCSGTSSCDWTGNPKNHSCGSGHPGMNFF